MGADHKAITRAQDSIFTDEPVSDVRKMLDVYSSEGWEMDASEILLLGGDAYPERLIQLRELVADIEELRADFNNPFTDGSPATAKAIHNRQRKIGELVYQSVCEFAEGWE